MLVERGFQLLHVGALGEIGLGPGGQDENRTHRFPAAAARRCARVRAPRRVTASSPTSCGQSPRRRPRLSEPMRSARMRRSHEMIPWKDHSAGKPGILRIVMTKPAVLVRSERQVFRLLQRDLVMELDHLRVEIGRKLRAPDRSLRESASGASRCKCDRATQQQARKVSEWHRRKAPGVHLVGDTHGPLLHRRPPPDSSRRKRRSWSIAPSISATPAGCHLPAAVRDRLIEQRQRSHACCPRPRAISASASARPNSFSLLQDVLPVARRSLRAASASD